jgi:deoxyribodipyrimidine photo-lyase
MAGAMHAICGSRHGRGIVALFGTKCSLPGVRRGAQALRRDLFMAAPLVEVPQIKAVAGLEAGPIPRHLRLADDPCPYRQIGGRGQALTLMDSFRDGRVMGYARGMSSPLTAERACSRLSPHLAVGSISLREVVQGVTRSQPFQARLAWRDHFVQKLERQPDIETQCLQPSAEDLGRGTDGLEAWAKGETGLPFLDACMRYLNATGWLNFRMRAMVTSVASYHLWLDWRATGAVLARRFTDYEPGIHWPQVQMQSGTTGINRPRIYNPIKQGWDQDPKGIFTRRWLPELAAVPDIHLQSPWKWEGAARVLGRVYPEPMVDLASAGAAARLKLFSMRATPKARVEAIEVIERHIGARDGAARPKAPSAQLVMEF